MNRNTRRCLAAVLFATSVLTLGVSARAQNSVGVATRPSITVLDSTKEQDGLVGSVRRVKIETARIEIKDGRAVEGPAQLVEVTTYGIKGNRIENTSYPIGGSLVGKEEYKYDKRGNITEMTLRDDRGAILSREAYTYEFDKFGNWTMMVTSLVVFENGELKREPVEVTHRTLTYYFDDRVAKAVEEPAKIVEEPAKAVEEPGKVVEEPAKAVEEPIREIRVPNVPEPGKTRIEPIEVLNVELTAYSGSIRGLGEPPAVPNPVVTAQKRANDFYLTGRRQFDAGDVRGAVASYLQSIAIEPGSAEVFLNLGHAYLKLEKDRDAIKALNESVKLNPTVAEAFYALGLANYRVKRFREAADAFRKATTLSPRMGKAHYGLGLANQEMGDIHGLTEQYRILERIDRNLSQKLAQTFPQYNFSCRVLNGCP
jgi:tetratricopeptide (TPR) repeat protein